MLSRSLRTSTLAFLTAFATLAFLPGCSSQPKESLGRRGLELKLGLDKSKKLKLTKFKKTDGQSAEMFGVKMYVMSYEAQIKVLEAPETRVIPAYRGVLPGAYTPARTVFASSERGEPWGALMGYGGARSVEELKKGMLFDVSGKMNFEKSENGWTVIIGQESSYEVTKYK